MTYTQALMICRNSTSGYSAAQIREAAEIVLSSIDATEDDILDAGNAIGYAERSSYRVLYAHGARCSDLDDHPFSGAISAGDY